MQDNNQYLIQQIEASSFKDGHELQIPSIVSRNLVWVDEHLNFQEDEGILDALKIIYQNSQNVISKNIENQLNNYGMLLSFLHNYISK